ncbi:Uncharacterised protein [Chromobacterium violaceum]|uniref:Uncharacterized protein n=1 Tax=Chromobacterium violaceum TaxID=536 RepID=A0A447TJ45_CHRVL|nr:Uncharacterised protein [Chromobacterium violaceum]
MALQRKAAAVTVSPALADYLLALLEATRSLACSPPPEPRAGQALVPPRGLGVVVGSRPPAAEDVKAIFAPVAAHRLQSASGAPVERELDRLLAHVAIP